MLERVCELFSSIRPPLALFFYIRGSFCRCPVFIGPVHFPQLMGEAFSFRILLDVSADKSGAFAGVQYLRFSVHKDRDSPPPLLTQDAVVFQVPDLAAQLSLLYCSFDKTVDGLRSTLFAQSAVPRSFGAFFSSGPGQRWADMDDGVAFFLFSAPS